MPNYTHPIDRSTSPLSFCSSSYPRKATSTRTMPLLEMGIYWITRGTLFGTHTTIQTGSLIHFIVFSCLSIRVFQLTPNKKRFIPLSLALLYRQINLVDGLWLPRCLSIQLASHFNSIHGNLNNELYSVLDISSNQPAAPAITPTQKIISASMLL